MPRSFGRPRGRSGLRSAAVAAAATTTTVTVVRRRLRGRWPPSRRCVVQASANLGHVLTHASPPAQKVVTRFRCILDVLDFLSTHTHAQEYSPYSNTALGKVPFDGFCAWAAIQHTGQTVGVWPKDFNPRPSPGSGGCAQAGGARGGRRRRPEPERRRDRRAAAGGRAPRDQGES
eukprot:SAG22_NODE_1292_length_4851_cov_4.982323_3_plen_175_part_00